VHEKNLNIGVQPETFSYTRDQNYANYRA